MSESMKTFYKRLKKIDKIQSGGMFSAKRRKAKGYKPLRLPVFHLLLFFALTYCALTGTKIYLAKGLGEQGYTAHLAKLADGGEGSRVAAKLLKRDRFMIFVEDKI